MEVLFEAVGRPAKKSQPPPFSSSSTSSHSVENDTVDELRLQMRDLEFKVDVLENARNHDLRDDLSAHEARLMTANKKVERLLAAQSSFDKRLADIEARLHEHGIQPHMQAAEEDGHSVQPPSSQGLVPEENMQPVADAARKTLSELQSKMYEITDKLVDIEDMRRQLEDSLWAFEDEKNSLRRTILLINDPKMQDDDEKSKESPSLHKKRSFNVEKRTWHQRLPNLYKAINAENTGYDPTHSHIEKRYTALTFLGILVCLLIMTFIFSSHTFTETEKIERPSVGDYLDIMYLNNRVGLPECPCEFPIMTWGNATGFVDGVSYELDSWCKPQPGPPDIFKDVKYEIMGETKKYVEAIDIPFSGMSPSDVKNAEVLGAYISYVYETIREYIDYLMCPVADDILKKSLNNYLQQFYVSDSLKTQDTLIKTVKQQIMAMAYNAGLVFETGFLTEEEISLLSINPTTKFAQIMAGVQPGNLANYVQPCIQIAPLPCTQAPGIEPGMMIVQCCAVQDYYRLQCYSGGPGGPGGRGRGASESASNACANRLESSEYENTQCAVLQIPCTEPLKDLAQRYNLTEYRHIADGVKASMLKGMSMESKAKRTATLSGLPPGSRRLSTDTTEANVGYLWTFSEAATFSRYYHLCKPLECQYTIQRDKFYGVFYVITGLVGGIIAVFKSGCGCLAAVNRQAAAVSAGRVDAATIVS